MEKIFVVRGETGEHDDYTTWYVVAYTNKEHARKHVEAAQKRANEIKDILDSDNFNPYEASKHTNDYDKFMQMDYTGTEYCYEKLEIYGDVLEYKLMI